MSLITVNGLEKSKIEALLRAKASFEVVGLRGELNKSLAWIEKKIESQNLKCRVKTDTKGAIAQGGIFGSILSAVSLPVGITLAAAATIATAGHTIATYDPDYEILKDYFNKKLKVIYKKTAKK